MSPVEILLALAALFAACALTAFLASIVLDRIHARFSEPLEQPRKRRADLNETRHGSSF